jgi:hypothetical protein
LTFESWLTKFCFPNIIANYAHITSYLATLHLNKHNISPGSQSFTLKLFSGEADLSSIFDAVYQLTNSWSDFCKSLGLPDSKITTIREDNADDKIQSLRDGVHYWLQGNCGSGPPTWKQLIIAVDNTFTEGSHDLAMKLAEQHKGNLHAAQCKNGLECHKNYSVHLRTVWN